MYDTCFKTKNKEINELFSIHTYISSSSLEDELAYVIVTQNNWHTFLEFIYKETQHKFLTPFFGAFLSFSFINQWLENG